MAETEPEIDEYVGYEGAQGGAPMEVPAGTLVIWSDTTFHRSGPNTSRAQRRVYVTQWRLGRDDA